MIGNDETQKLMAAALHFRAQLKSTATAKRIDIDSMKTLRGEAENFLGELTLAVAGGEDQVNLITKTLVELDKAFPIVDEKVISLPAGPARIPVVEK